MSDRSPLTTSPLAWGRALAFAATAVGLGAAGHARVVAIELSAPVLLAVLACFAVFLLGARLASRVRASAVELTIGLVVGQLCVHLACWLVESTSGPTTMAGMPDMPAHGALVASSSPVVGQLLAMLAVHAVATVFAVAVLARLERRAWRASARVLAAVVGWLRPGNAAVRSAQLEVAARRPSTTGDVAPRRISLLFSAGRRGPPVLVS